jgi:hypothetical protein
MLRPIVFAALVTVVCLSAQQPAAPPPRTDPGRVPMTFKVEVNYIEIDATVTDGQGRAVADLRREDFQLSEDDKPQATTVFSHVALPVERPDPLLSRRTIVEPDARTNNVLRIEARSSIGAVAPAVRELEFSIR